ncbi:hypothetical protein A6452_28845 [Bradyrhizobium elkanii]|nr:hypothetical protein A6452_28845 [Bradyrhizobium elkanii]
METIARGEHLDLVDIVCADAIAEISRLTLLVGEADRAAGNALRQVSNLEETTQKRNSWLREAKASEGYSDNTSFDDVWANVRAERDRLKALVAADPVKADTDRLDWLDRVNERANQRNGSRYGWKFDINHNRAALTDCNSPALSVRVAIDAARSRS